MTIQFIRKNGKIRGVAVLLTGGRFLALATADASGNLEYWRVCDHCAKNEAAVFCQTHSQYVCESCLQWHGRRELGGAFILGYPCHVMSMAVARELAAQAVCGAEVEA